MRKNYFAKLVNDMKNVYHIDRGINKLKDGRVNPKYKTRQVILPLLLGFLIRIESMNELKFMLQENEFANIFSRETKLPQIDTIRDTIKVVDVKRLKKILQNTVVRAIKNKVYVSGTIDGYTVGAIDGTKFIGSNKKICSECLTNQNYHFHSGAVMSTIGNGPKLTAGFEIGRPGEDPTAKDEGEMNVAKRLISADSSTYPNFIDVVVYDALACNAQWINHCLDLGLDVVIRAKKNNNSSIRAIKRKVHTLDPVETWDHEAVLYLMFIANNIMQLFILRRLKRHFETQREIVRLLLKGLYRLIYRKELVFSTA